MSNLEAIQKRRIFGIISHPDAGKTTLTEKLLLHGGAILEVNGLTYTDVVKTTCFLADMGDFATFNEVYAKYFTGKPARSCVAVKTLPKNVLCEVEILAVTKK